jgi:hypothetical protein
LIWCWKLTTFGALVSSRCLECNARVNRIHVESIIRAYEGNVLCNEYMLGLPTVESFFSHLEDMKEGFKFEISGRSDSDYV